MLIKDNSKYNLYYEQYKYKAEISLPGIQWFRIIKTLKDFENRLDSKISTRYTWPMMRTGLHPSDISIKNIIIEDNSIDAIESIRKFIEWRQSSNSAEVKIVITQNKASVYTNDVASIEELDDYISVIKYIEPIQNWERGVVYHKQPKHKYRLYFKNKKFNETEKNLFLDFINAHKCSPSNLLNSGFKQSSLNFKGIFRQLSSLPVSRWTYLRNSHYVDFDDESFITVIGLNYSDIIRKICRIEKLIIA